MQWVIYIKMKQFLFKVHLSDFYLFIEMMSTFHNIYHTATQGANTKQIVCIFYQLTLITNTIYIPSKQSIT